MDIVYNIMVNEIKKDENITIIPKQDINDKYIIKKSISLQLNIINIDNSINISFELEENAKLNLFTGTINKNNIDINIDINHLETSNSNIVNHILNVNNGYANLIINAKVNKGEKNCVLNQDNKIINMKDGKCLIKPNLLIDEYSSYANHSGYISKFKNDDIFYLMSRGIDKGKTLELLTKSFLLSNMSLKDSDKSFFINEIENIWKEESDE